MVNVMGNMILQREYHGEHFGEHDTGNVIMGVSWGICYCNGKIMGNMI